MVIFLVDPLSFFGSSTQSTVEVLSQFKNWHLLLKNVSLLSPRPVTDTRLEPLVVMVQSLTGTIRMPLWSLLSTKSAGMLFSATVEDVVTFL